MKAWRIGSAAPALGMGLLGVGMLGLAIGGCTPQTAPPPVAAPAISYDGIYRGSLTLAGVGAGVPAQGCATSPQLVFQVNNNAFTYVQAHPNANVTAPGMATVSATTTYSVAIAPNGSFSGQSAEGGTMTGAIAGTRMTGNIEGMVCVYTFVADRV